MTGADLFRGYLCWCNRARTASRLIAFAAQCRPIWRRFSRLCFARPIDLPSFCVVAVASLRATRMVSGCVALKQQHRRLLTLPVLPFFVPVFSSLPVECLLHRAFSLFICRFIIACVSSWSRRVASVLDKKELIRKHPMPGGNALQTAKRGHAYDPTTPARGANNCSGRQYRLTLVTRPTLIPSMDSSMTKELLARAAELTVGLHRKDCAATNFRLQQGEW